MAACERTSSRHDPRRCPMPEPHQDMRDALIEATSLALALAT